MNNFSLQFGLLRSRVFREMDNPEVYRQLLLCMAFSGDDQSHLSLYEEVLNANPYASLAWFNLGLTYRYLNRTEEALEALEYAWISNPFLEEAYHAYADLALQSGAVRKAQACLLELSTRVEPDSTLLIRLSECYLHLGELEQARETAKQALQLDPFNPDACFLLGNCFARERQDRLAVRWIREAIRQEERRGEFHTELADIYSRMGREKDACLHYRRAIDLAPDEALGWIQLAALLLHHSRTEEALELLTESVDYATGPELQYCRAACLFLLDRAEEALPVLNLALEENFERHEDLFRWAPILAQNGNVQTAIARFH